MANRIMLNETSYHGSGAIQEIATEAKAHGFKKALVCSDPDLIKFGVTRRGMPGAEVRPGYKEGSRSCERLPS